MIHSKKMVSFFLIAKPSSGTRFSCRTLHQNHPPPRTRSYLFFNARLSFSFCKRKEVPCLKRPFRTLLPAHGHLISPLIFFQRHQPFPFPSYLASWVPLGRFTPQYPLPFLLYGFLLYLFVPRSAPEDSSLVRAHVLLNYFGSSRHPSITVWEVFFKYCHRSFLS